MTDEPELQNIALILREHQIGIQEVCPDRRCKLEIIDVKSHDGYHFHKCECGNEFRTADLEDKRWEMWKIEHIPDACRWTLPVEMGKGKDRAKRYDVPARGALRLILSEAGGKKVVKDKEEGYARIITNNEGEKLKPFRIRQRGELACKEHAYFSIRHATVVEADLEGNLSLTGIGMHGLADKDRQDFIKVTKSVFWKKKIDFDKLGESETEDEQKEVLGLGRRWDHFFDAVMAAIEKVNIHHCRDVVYYRT